VVISEDIEQRPDLRRQSPANDSQDLEQITPPRAGIVTLPAEGYRDVLAIRRFRRLWVVQLVAGLGEALASVAMPLLAYKITGSEALVGLIFVVQLVPRVLLAPVAGVLADRLDRRRVMLGADLSRAFLVALLPFATSAWQIGIVAGLVAAAGALARPAEMAAVPMVVPRSELVRALAIFQVSGSVVRVVGPAIGAGLVGIAGPAPAFGIQAACFFCSSSLLWRFALPVVERVTLPGGFFVTARREAWEGIRVVWTNRIVRGIAAVEALWQVTVAALFVTSVVFLEKTMGLGDRGDSVYALLTATFSGGAALGAVAAGHLERRIGRARLMAVGYLAPLMLAPLALTPPLPIVFACLFILGLADAWAVIGMQAYLAEAVPDALRGRVYAGWSAAVYLGGAIAFGAVGWTTDRLGPPATMAIAGLLVGCGGPLLLLVTGALADIRRGGDESRTVVVEAI